MGNLSKNNIKGLFQQFMKFGLVGFLAFLIDFGVMVFLTEAFGIDPVISATVSFIVSVLFNYLASMRFVFARRDDISRLREMLVFIALSVVGLVINDALMWAGADILSIDYRIVKLFATAVVMVWNFVTRKIFLEAK